VGAVGLILGSTALGAEWSGPAASGVFAVQRHGAERYVPAHLIDHAANLRLLADQGCDRLLAISSVGSLRPDLPVGSLLCPDDFIALHIGASSFDDHRGHRVPSFDAAWRTRVLSAWSESSTEPLIEAGVYWQAIGPRFETPAEIRLIAAHAHVIGMTVAAECVIAGELGLPYAAICVVDNLANGIGPRPLTVAEFEAGRDSGATRLARALGDLMPRLTGETA